MLQVLQWPALWLAPTPCRRAAGLSEKLPVLSLPQGEHPGLVTRGQWGVHSLEGSLSFSSKLKITSEKRKASLLMYLYLKFPYNRIWLSCKTEGESAVCDVNELQGHCAKWNTPGRERQMLCDLTYVQSLFFLSQVHRTSRMVPTRGWGMGERSRCWSKGTNIYL